MATARSISPAPSDQEADTPLKPYFVPASDANGHSARLLLRVPPTLKNQLGSACTGDQFPWKDESAVGRWCLAAGLGMIARLTVNRDFKTVQAALDAWIAQAQTQMEMLHFKKVLTVLQSGVDELLAAGHLPAARKILESVKEKIDMIDDPFWRTTYQHDFVDRYSEQMGLPVELKVGVTTPSKNVAGKVVKKRRRE